MEGLKPQYLMLDGLRQIEKSIYRIEQELERIPIEAGRLTDKLIAQKESLEAAQGLLETQEKAHRLLEMELKEKESALKKAQDKLMEVKTNDEYGAAVRENESQKRSKGELEDRVLASLSQLEERRKSFQATKSEFSSYETQTQKEIAILDEDRQNRVRILEEAMSERKTAISKLSVDLQGIYHRAVARSKGVPIATVERGMCVGCNMKLRAQLYNEILGFKAVHRCPSCGKILIIAGLAENLPDRQP